MVHFVQIWSYKLVAEGYKNSLQWNKACVKINGVLSERFSTKQGVSQRCVRVSP